VGGTRSRIAVKDARMMRMFLRSIWRAAISSLFRIELLITARFEGFRPGYSSFVLRLPPVSLLVGLGAEEAQEDFVLGVRVFWGGAVALTLRPVEGVRRVAKERAAWIACLLVFLWSTSSSIEE